MKGKLNPETLEQIAQVVIKTIEKEKTNKEKQIKDYRLRNTNLLLKNYHILKEHCEEVELEIINYVSIEVENDKIELESIIRSKEKTRRMILYIDTMLDAYDRYSHKNGEAGRRRYRALYHYYISEQKMTYYDIAELLNVHDRTVRKDLADARKEFSIFLFGILSLEDID
ncbi:MAG TPA: helix-turn-helix domain-containing protein [Candidatus Jeotgalibaca merdavium]|uniref:Helix-turn-helix domain-containing protein n=1 Tax=Candidatus Jeotgalibaca merdavium TaxID=2838627 RepID=A0A9D2I1I5_9LACT|nr:helix-turn-helix domain-containing protein [Candidatus Jeotgalibaca merdavium]